MLDKYSYFHLSYSEVGYMYFCLYVYLYYNSVRTNVACSYLDLTKLAFTSSIELTKYVYILITVLNFFDP